LGGASNYRSLISFLGGGDQNHFSGAALSTKGVTTTMEPDANCPASFLYLIIQIGNAIV